jgi:hypothetical protein
MLARITQGSETMLGPVVHVEVREGRQEYGFRQDKDGSKWKVTIWFDAMDGRRATKVWPSRVKLSKQRLRNMLDRIFRAQCRAAHLRGQRLRAQSHPTVAQMAVAEVFGHSKLSEPEWLARIAAECGDEYATTVLQGWIKQRRLNLVAAYIDEQKKLQEAGKGTLKRALNLFLFAYWPQLNYPGTTATKAHQLATDKIGQNDAGTLESFQKYCQRKGITFAPPHRPKN